MNKIFVFEGVDGVGKSTLLAKVYIHLRRIFNKSNWTIRQWKETLAHSFKGKHETTHLFFGVGSCYRLCRQCLYDMIKQESQLNTINLNDRSYLSTIVYQGDKDTKIYPVDKVFLLVKDPEKIAQQLSKRGNLSKFDTLDIDLIKERQQKYLELAKDYKHNIMVLDADKFTLGELVGQVLTEIEKQINKGV